jgi:hypothetical protein
MNSSISLADTQQLFQQGILHTHNKCDALIVSDEKASATQRMMVYRRSYFGALLQCLRTQFSITTQTLGQDIFDAFAYEYLETYPSKSYTLAMLGENFVKFLQQNRPDKNQDKKEEWIEFIVELSEFEWAMNIAFDALEQPSLQCLDSNNTLYSMSGNIVIFHHQFATYAHYYAYSHKHDTPMLAQRQQNYFGIIRKDYTLHYFALSYLEYQTIKEAQRTNSIINEGKIARLIRRGIIIAYDN